VNSEEAEMPKAIEDVRQFWENNPLFSGESRYQPGSREFFEEHRKAYIEDVFVGELDHRVFPGESITGKVLDLGCGPGFWTVELGVRGYDVVAADLTANALRLCHQRCEIYGVSAEFSLQNAEGLGFGSGAFAHVNC